MRSGWLVATVVVVLVVAFALLLLFLPNKQPSPTGPASHQQHGQGPVTPGP